MRRGRPSRITYLLVSDPLLEIRADRSFALEQFGRMKVFPGHQNQAVTNVGRGSR